MTGLLIVQRTCQCGPVTCTDPNTGCEQCVCVCVGSLRDRVPVVITKQERGEQQMRPLRWMASLQRDFKNSNLLTSANRKQCFVFLLLA